jgi:tight adherence protein B
MTQPEIAALIAGAGILMMTFAVFQMATQALLDGRLRTFVQRGSISVQPVVSVRRAKKMSRIVWVEDINRRLRQADYSKQLQMRLVRAGVDMQASRFMVIQVIGMAVGFILVWYFAGKVPELKGFGSLIVALPVIPIAWFVPLMSLGFMEGQRLKKLELQLAPTIDSMAGALQAGSSLPQAMEMASREMAAPIGEELAIAVREMAVGVPMQEAFAHMLERARSLDLDMLVTAITIQHRIGGNLGQILRTISHTIRERLRIRGEIAILTAQQRMSAYIVSALPVLIIGALFVLAPDYISKLFQPGIARVLLIMGAFGMVAGFYALMRIADIDV